MCNKHMGYCCIGSDFWNIGMGYRCDDGAIGQECMVYRSDMSEWRRVKS